MKVVLTLTRYRSKHIIFALHAMALFRPSLFFNANISFFQLLGCGKNGTFDIHPDWNQYGIFSVQKDDGNLELLQQDYASWKKATYGSFIAGWWKFFGCTTMTVLLDPIMAHGTWAGKELFKDVKPSKQTTGNIAVLTRASIRLTKVTSFFKNVPAVEKQMHQADGLLFSVGVGEAPLIRQATFSIWENTEKMKAFAYNMQQHREVIRKTREEKWYSEEMFARFSVQYVANQGFNIVKLEASYKNPI
jgi:hypothetical protein